MNCFHFWVSLGYNTTLIDIYCNPVELWIAFIFEYLWDTTQPVALLFINFVSCELLSFLSIFGIQHNCETVGKGEDVVVNCFHFWVSLGYNTTHRFHCISSMLLWIAFIFEYLWDTTQQNIYRIAKLESCELLSFLSIFGIQHNPYLFPNQVIIVVNCFHFWVSLGYNTTRKQNSVDFRWLWIAFIFEYLWDTTQQTSMISRFQTCCELLSFLSIFGIQHNKKFNKVFLTIVVNCFHFWVSLGYNTTQIGSAMKELGLWIAFIFEYLWDTTQPS